VNIGAVTNRHQAACGQYVHGGEVQAPPGPGQLPGQEAVTCFVSGGGRCVADGQPDGPVAEVGDEVQPAAEGLDVAGDDLEGGDLAVLDLGYPGDTYVRGGGDLLLAQAQLLAGLGELVPARPGRPPARFDGVYSSVRGRP